MNDQIKPLYDLLTGHFHWLPMLVTWLGALKLFFHFVGPWLQTKAAGIIADIVASSDKDDDHFLVVCLSAQWYKVACFILRLASLPMPTLSDYDKAVASASAERTPGVMLGFAIALSLCMFATGCQTGVAPGAAPITVNTNGLVSIGTWTVNTNDVYTAIHIGATLGTEQAIKADTNSVPYLVIVDAVLTTAISSQQYDPAQIQTAIDAVSIKEVRGNQDVANGINMTLQLYRVFFGHVVDQHLQNVSPYLDPALRAVRDGITESLAAHAVLQSVTPVATTTN